MIGLDLGTVAAGSLPVVYSNLIGSVGFLRGCCGLWVAVWALRGE
jgi:hypothetical protein